MAIELNITDDALDALSGADIKAHISAISGQPERKIATRGDGLKTLRRLRQWAMNQDGLLGVPKDSKPVVRSYSDLQAKAASKGKTLAELPKSHERVTPIDPEWDDEIVDGDAAVSDALERASEAAGSARAPETCVAPPASLPEGDMVTDGAVSILSWRRADSPTVEGEPNPDMRLPAHELHDETETTEIAAGVSVKIGDETIVHPRGTMRARLAQIAAKATPIKLAPSAMKDRRPKKETGEARKQREPLHAVKATMTGVTKLQNNSTRANVLVYVQTRLNREIPGWPKGTVLPEEIDRHFQIVSRPYLHKLIEDGHLARVSPNLPELPTKKTVEPAQS